MQTLEFLNVKVKFCFFRTLFENLPIALEPRVMWVVSVVYEFFVGNYTGFVASMYWLCLFFWLSDDYIKRVNIGRCGWVSCRHWKTRPFEDSVGHLGRGFLYVSLWWIWFSGWTRLRLLRKSCSNYNTEKIGAIFVNRGFSNTKNFSVFKTSKNVL